MQACDMMLDLAASEHSGKSEPFHQVDPLSNSGRENGK